MQSYQQHDTSPVPMSRIGNNCVSRNKSATPSGEVPVIRCHRIIIRGDSINEQEITVAAMNFQISYWKFTLVCFVLFSGVAAGGFTGVCLLFIYRSPKGYTPFLSSAIWFMLSQNMLRLI
jgi:hypothetical protein